MFAQPSNPSAAAHSLVGSREDSRSRTARLSATTQCQADRTFVPNSENGSYFQADWDHLSRGSGLWISEHQARTPSREIIFTITITININIIITIIIIIIVINSRSHYALLAMGLCQWNSSCEILFLITSPPKLSSRPPQFLKHGDRSFNSIVIALQLIPHLWPS